MPALCKLTFAFPVYIPEPFGEGLSACALRLRFCAARCIPFLEGSIGALLSAFAAFPLLLKAAARFALCVILDFACRRSLAGSTVQNILIQVTQHLRRTGGSFDGVAQHPDFSRTQFSPFSGSQHSQFQRSYCGAFESGYLQPDRLAHLSDLSVSSFINHNLQHHPARLFFQHGYVSRTGFLPSISTPVDKRTTCASLISGRTVTR